MYLIISGVPIIYKMVYQLSIKSINRSLNQSQTSVYNTLFIINFEFNQFELTFLVIFQNLITKSLVSAKFPIYSIIDTIHLIGRWDKQLIRCQPQHQFPTLLIIFKQDSQLCIEYIATAIFIETLSTDKITHNNPMYWVVLSVVNARIIFINT